MGIYIVRRLREAYRPRPYIKLLVCNLRPRDCVQINRQLISCMCGVSLIDLSMLFFRINSCELFTPIIVL